VGVVRLAPLPRPVRPSVAEPGADLSGVVDAARHAIDPGKDASRIAAERTRKAALVAAAVARDDEIGAARPLPAEHARRVRVMVIVVAGALTARRRDAREAVRSRVLG